MVASSNRSQISLKIKSKTNEAKALLDKTFDEIKIREVISELDSLKSNLNEVNLQLSNLNVEIISREEIEIELDFLEELKSRIYNEMTGRIIDRLSHSPSEENKQSRKVFQLMEKAFELKSEDSEKGTESEPLNLEKLKKDQDQDLTLPSREINSQSS